MSYDGNNSQRWGHISYAQHGDDFALLSLCQCLGLVKPTYLDIGANHPETLSNTKLLYDRGASGVNVEANPDLMAEFEKQRPRDINVCVGVGPETGVLPFHMYGRASGLNTFCEDEVKRLPHIPVQNVRNLPVITIDMLVSNHCGGVWPDLLLLDIEGFDYDVIRTATFKKTDTFAGPEFNCPKIICVETRPKDTGRMSSLLLEKGYSMYSRMGENLFFVRSDLYFKAYGVS